MVIRVKDKGLVGLAPFGGAVHGSCGGEGPLGDDLAESNGLVILGFISSRNGGKTPRKKRKLKERICILGFSRKWKKQTSTRKKNSTTSELTRSSFYLK